MPCTPIRLEGGGVAIVCTGRGGKRIETCRGCGTFSSKLCDYPLRGGKKGATCSAPICAKCALTVAPDFDLCPAHAKGATTMHHTDGDQKPGEQPWRWLSVRDNPRAEVGELGTIGDCEPGDLVVAQSLDGERYVWALIAFRINAGFDERDAFAHLFDRSLGRIPLGSESIRCLPSRMRIRWLGVRPAFPSRRK